MSLRARTWHRRNTFSHREFPCARLAAEREATVSLCLPARNEARTIGAILKELMPLTELGVVDQLLVLDHSTDGTGDIARRLGAEVYEQESLMPELGPVRGKGDAMWRSLPILRGELVCFLDADSEGFGAHFACGLLGPLICRGEISFVKGCYRRPFRLGDQVFPDGGGRVTELMARPLLNLFYPDLAGVEQPLAGELAARRELLERLPFVTGYGVDVALLVDAYEAVGLDGIAQVDLDVRQNAHQPLRDLGPMAYEVLKAVASRLEREGRLQGPLAAEFAIADAAGLETVATAQLERPPLTTLRAAA
ncbi:MAG TPA: glucosyl-3-phosphoglycerate synthase [Solirubrobacteraceae bacterium]|nr:glucosyl-3-phosphoglycerate synthase [Solirubrobacteraceae bacterium]